MPKQLTDEDIDALAKRVRDKEPDAYTSMSLRGGLLPVIQRERARKPRHRDPLSRDIADILSADPNANTAKVLAEFRRMAGARQGSIVSVTDDDGVEWTDAKGDICDTTVANLRSRISRQKKKLLR